MRYRSQSPKCANMSLRDCDVMAIHQARGLTMVATCVCGPGASHGLQETHTCPLLTCIHFIRKWAFSCITTSDYLPLSCKGKFTEKLSERLWIVYAYQYIYWTYLTMLIFSQWKLFQGGVPFRLDNYWQWCADTCRDAILKFHCQCDGEGNDR